MIRQENLYAISVKRIKQIACSDNQEYKYIMTKLIEQIRKKKRKAKQNQIELNKITE
jgi:aldehyde:ferredoxin oxidoreductase